MFCGLAEKYESKIKLKHEANGKITTSSYDLHYRYNNDEKDYTHHEFTPFKKLYKVELPKLDCKGKNPDVFKHPEGAAHKAIRQALGGAYFSFHNC